MLFRSACLVDKIQDNSWHDVLESWEEKWKCKTEREKAANKATLLVLQSENSKSPFCLFFKLQMIRGRQMEKNKFAAAALFPFINEWKIKK